MKTECFECDGLNCDKKANSDHWRSNWIFIYQPVQYADWWSLKLDGELHFCSIECLSLWADKAAEIRESLAKSNENFLYPQGCVRADLPGVYV